MHCTSGGKSKAVNLDMPNPYTNFIGVTFSDALSASINSAVQTNPGLQESLNEFEDKTVLLQISDIRHDFVLTVQDGIVLVGSEIDGNADLTVRGTLVNFVKALTSGNLNPTQIENLDIVGDMKLAQRLYGIFSNTDFDWEEEAAKRVGDVPARQLGNLLRWGRQNVIGNQSPLAKKIQSVLAEETYLLPPRSRVEKFLNNVDELQARVDRLSKRTDRLER